MARNGRNRIRTAALGTFILVAAGCSGSATTTTSVTPTTAPPTTTTTTTTVPTTTATSTTTTTVDPLARPEKLVSNFDRDSVDDFDTTGDDLYRVVLELADLFNYLEGNPLDSAATMVDLLLEPDYPYRQAILRDFSELVDNEWRYADAGIEIVGIELVEASGDVATVRIADRRGDQLLVNAAGETTKTYPGWNLDIATFTFSKGEDGRWRYAHVGEFSAATAADLETMVPVQWVGRSQ